MTTFTPESASVLATTRAATQGLLPARYATDLWDARFREALNPLLVPGVRVLDIGAGARPTVVPADRPSDCTYVGLDISADELAMAAPGSYDEVIVGDAMERVADLEGRFDLVVSWMVFEHVRSLERVFANIRAYLQPEGHLVAQFAGRFSPFALAGSVVPLSVARWILPRIQERDVETIFPAHYDKCWHTAIERVLSDWGAATIRPIYTAAGYVTFSRVLTAAYLPYEEWLYRTDRRNLAPYYLVSARAS